MHKKCLYCGETIYYDKFQVYASHMGNCKFSPKREEKIRKQREKLRKREEYTLNCKKCGKEYVVFVTPTAFKKGNYTKHCSRSCANSRIQTEEQNERKRKSMIKTLVDSGWRGRPANIMVHKRKYIFECKECGIKKEIFTRVKIPTQKYCSRECSCKNAKKVLKENAVANKIGYELYSWKCRFNFGLSMFPNEFDFGLIDKYGWYKSDGKNNNLIGVSRDHMISVKYGFNNNVETEVISHPANCKLMIHSENSSKNSKCSITIVELQERIKNWNKKYGL